MDSNNGSSAGVCAYLRRGSHDCPQLGHARSRKVGRNTGLNTAGLGDFKMHRMDAWDFIVRALSELLIFGSIRGSSI